MIDNSMSNEQCAMCNVQCWIVLKSFIIRFDPYECLVQDGPISPMAERNTVTKARNLGCITFLILPQEAC